MEQRLEPSVSWVSAAGETWEGCQIKFKEPNATYAIRIEGGVITGRRFSPQNGKYGNWSDPEPIRFLDEGGGKCVVRLKLGPKEWKVPGIYRFHMGPEGPVVMICYSCDFKRPTGFILDGQTTILKLRRIRGVSFVRPP